MKNKGQQAAKTLDEKYVNKKFGVLYVIEFTYKIKYRKFYKCKCSRCNNFTNVRSDHLLKLPKSCGNCVNSLQKEIADIKYKELRKYKNIFNSYKSNANSRNIKFDLTLNDVVNLVDSNCYYCNDIDSKGIDRMNNDKHYYIDNCVACCQFCNTMKNNYTIKETFEKVKNIYNNQLYQSSTTILKRSTIK